jgi:rod shape-determining protein MreC
MSNIYPRYRRIVLPIGLWLFSLILVSVQSYQEKTRPSPFSRALAELTSYPERSYAYSAGGIKGVWNNYLYLAGVQRQNLELQKQIANLLIENQSLQEQALENQRLKALLEFKDSTNFLAVPAKIIGWDLSTYARTVKINAGSKQGIHQGQAVISSRGLVGQIIDEPGRLSGAHWAQVLLITDPTSRVSVLIERTRDRGILEGAGREQGLLLKYIPPEAKPQPGDVVVTSGLGGIFPAGLKVGVIEKIEQNVFSASPQCWVKPSADFNRLEELLVLKGVNP